jgi:hypothetical protein
MKLNGTTWEKVGSLLVLVETGQAWLVGEWSYEDYLTFLGLGDQDGDLATSTRQLYALSNLVEVK